MTLTKKEIETIMKSLPRNLQHYIIRKTKTQKALAMARLNRNEKTTGKSMLNKREGAMRAAAHARRASVFAKDFERATTENERKHMFGSRYQYDSAEDFYNKRLKRLQPIRRLNKMENLKNLAKNRLKQSMERKTKGT